MVSLGIDIGGTGCKCVAFSSSGQQLALAYKEYPLAAGTVNLPAEVLTESVFAVIAQCCSQIEDKTAIRVVTVSSFGESFVPVDEQGKTLTDILMYFGNAESEEFDRLVDQVGRERFVGIAKAVHHFTLNPSQEPSNQ
jgi:xylulokinase